MPRQGNASSSSKKYHSWGVLSARMTFKWAKVSVITNLPCPISPKATKLFLDSQIVISMLSEVTPFWWHLSLPWPVKALSPRICHSKPWKFLSLWNTPSKLDQLYRNHTLINPSNGKSMFPPWVLLLYYILLRQKALLCFLMYRIFMWGEE